MRCIHRAPKLKIIIRNLFFFLQFDLPFVNSYSIQSNIFIMNSTIVLAIFISLPFTVIFHQNNLLEIPLEPNVSTNSIRSKCILCSPFESFRVQHSSKMVSLYNEPRPEFSSVKRSLNAILIQNENTNVIKEAISKRVICVTKIMQYGCMNLLEKVNKNEEDGSFAFFENDPDEVIKNCYTAFYQHAKTK